MRFDQFLMSPLHNFARKEGYQMNENLMKIHDYLLSKGVAKERIENSDCSTVELASEIMEYAHRNQKRENGEDYANHPTRVLWYYRDLVGIVPGDCFCIDKDAMLEHGIPFQGVQEVCLLHDVIEDSELTLEDVKAIYVDCGFKDYFELYMEDALKRITHDKKEDYWPYIEKCVLNPVSAIVKMMDLQDNLRVVDLTSFDESKLKRSFNYLSYFAFINKIHQFLEGAKAYRDEFASTKTQEESQER